MVRDRKIEEPTPEIVEEVDLNTWISLDNEAVVQQADKICRFQVNLPKGIKRKGFWERLFLVC